MPGIWLINEGLILFRVRLANSGEAAEVSETRTFRDRRDLLLHCRAHVGESIAELARVKASPIPAGRRPANFCLIESSVVSHGS